MELHAGEEQRPRVLSEPAGAEELLLLQDRPQGRVHRRQPLHARQVRGERLPGGPSRGCDTHEGQFLQYI